MSILTFKKQLEENKTNRKLNIGLGITLNPYPINIFYLASIKSNVGTSLEKPQYYSLIKLDEEDIDYFKNKYFKKLDEEMEIEINNLKQKYK